MRYSGAGRTVSDDQHLCPNEGGCECHQLLVLNDAISATDAFLATRQLPRCNKALQESCVTIFDEINCRAAQSFCQDQVSGVFERSGMYMPLSDHTCELRSS